MNEKIPAREKNIGKAIEGINKWIVPGSVKLELKKFIKELRMGKVNRGKRVEPATAMKYLMVLRSPLCYVNKQTKDVTLKDTETWDGDITSGKLKSNRGKPYSHSMIVDSRIAWRIYLKHIIGEKKGDELAGWFDCRDKTTTPDYLKSEEIAELFEACKNKFERYLIAVLFDGGPRAEEFLNIRYEDIDLPTGQNNYVKLTLKEEYSKTLGRVISLFKPETLKAVKDYVDERLAEGMKTSDPVFTRTYDNARQFLRNLGKRVLDKKINFHLFRHSSATSYATDLNRQELCYRFGWKFSSNMPDVYISRSGMNNKDLDEKFTNTALSEVKGKMAKQEMELNMMRDKLKDYDNVMAHWETFKEDLKEMGLSPKKS